MNDAGAVDAQPVGFLEHGGEMGARIRAFDWMATPLGPPQAWPQALRSVVRIMLDSRDAMWLAWGRELTFLCNDAQLAFAGMRAERVLGARSGSAWGDAWTGIGPRVECVLRDGEPIRDEGRVLLVERGGHLEAVYHTLSLTPLRDDAGSTAGVLCVVIDETNARARAEAALRESEARFRAMADSAPLLIWMTDPAGRIEFVNCACREFFGVADAALAQGGWSALLHPEDAEGYLAEVTAALAEHRSFSVMARVRRNDGEWRWIQSFGAPRFAADGRFLGAVGSSPDITELIEASDTLRDADRRKDEFLATLAHELRNPLAPIRQAARLWRSPLATEAQRRWSQEVIERQVQHMSLLLDDLLDVSRITRGKVELHRQRVRLAAVVDAAIETARPFLDARRHGLTLDVPAEPIELDVDSTRIAQVLSNLLTNAAKYSEAGRQIVVAAAREGGGVAISVRDAGIGIDPELLPRVFDMFSQVQTSLDRAEGGLGIGLALVKGLVELHGGRVEARSAGLGRGAEFVVWLPLPEGAAAAAPRDERRILDRPAAPARILIADDNRDAASSLASLLALDGHETRVVNDGALAISAAHAFKPHVALLDIGMPRLNGYEVAREIRAAPWGKEVTLIAVTGWGQAEDKRRAQEAGFDHHFTKPLDLEVLDACLAEALGRRS